MKKLMIVGALAAIASGCVTVNENDGGESIKRPVTVRDAIHEKLDVSNKKVTATDNINCLFGFICWGSTATHVCDQTEFGFGMKAKAKDGAYANACDAGKCDQIVGARYKITTEDYFVFARCKAEVTGFPANVEKVEVIENKTLPPPCPAKKCGLF